MNWTLLKKYKKQFHLIRKALEDISQPNVNFNINYDQDKGTKSSVKTPQEKEFARFASVLSQLTDPTSPLHYKKIVSILLQENLLKMSEAEQEELSQNIQRMENGPIGIRFNDETFSALDLYLLFSKGEYFHDNDIESRKLRELKTNPIMFQLIVFQFHSYSMDVYRLCNYLYKLIREVESHAGNTETKKTTKAQVFQCIYCLTKEGTFTREEHVYPESPGNTEIILEPGHVCDECNSGTLSELDNYFVNHDMISFLRALYVPYNPKTGKFIEAKYQNVHLERTNPRNVLIKMQSGSKKDIDFKDLGDGKCSFKVTAKGTRPFNPPQLGRALYKIALGILCWKNGAETALDKKYDAAREYISGKRLFSNNLVISKDCGICEHVEGSHVITSPGTLFIMNIFGVVFMFNLEPKPFIEMNSELEKMNFACHSLSHEI